MATSRTRTAAWRLTTALAATAFVASCAAPADRAATPTTRPTPAATVTTGVVTGISDNHGNVYTNIAPDAYEPLGLTPGRVVRVTWGDSSVEMPVGEGYTSVPTGEPVAVLHREGLTFAIRDGDFSATHGLSAGTAFELMAVP